MNTAEKRRELVERLRQNPSPEIRKKINAQLLSLARGESIQPQAKPKSGKEIGLAVFPLSEQLFWIRENTIYTDDVKDGMTTQMMYTFLYDATQAHNPGADFKDEMLRRIRAAGYSVEEW